MSEGTVLVVDDDRLIVELLTAALEDEGYTVLTSVGAHSLHMARERTPDVILLDIMMPGMDGVEVSQRLRADPITASIPIIAMSATDRLSAAETMQIDAKLIKPFDIDDLFAIVARCTSPDFQRVPCTLAI